MKKKTVMAVAKTDAGPNAVEMHFDMESIGSVASIASILAEITRKVAPEIAKREGDPGFGLIRQIQIANAYADNLAADVLKKVTPA